MSIGGKMNKEQFIAGTLVESKDGATYEGAVYDRLLKLQLPTGEVLPIFDGFNPISSGLVIGEWYEVVLLSLLIPGTVRYPERLSSSSANEIWQGTVREPKWRGKAKDYRFVRGYDFEDVEWALLETTWGYLLIYPKELAIPAEVGQILCWESLRLDLLAVV
jgi:hypothetical protein